jgi:hypothetical protein
VKEEILIKRHKLEDLVRSAIAEAELMYPGDELSAEVDMDETLTLIIKVFRESILETKVH